MPWEQIERETAKPVVVNEETLCRVYHAIGGLQFIIPFWGLAHMERPVGPRWVEVSVDRSTVEVGFEAAEEGLDTWVVTSDAHARGHVHAGAKVFAALGLEAPPEGEVVIVPHKWDEDVLALDLSGFKSVDPAKTTYPKGTTSPGGGS